MFRNINEIINYCKTEKVDIIDFKVVDMKGRWHRLSITSRKLSVDIMEKGIGFDGSSYGFLTVEKSYRGSYQPISVYHNNIWQSPFFARIYANSNTFWPISAQIRQEKIATYSFHYITWKTLLYNDFLSTSMDIEYVKIFFYYFLFFCGVY